MSDLLWKWPPSSRKAHVFGKDDFSLCGKWVYAGPPTRTQKTSDKPGPDDCAICFRKAKRAKVQP